jgi:hypothetical protein
LRSLGDIEDVSPTDEHLHTGSEMNEVSNVYRVSIHDAVRKKTANKREDLIETH